MNLQHSAAVKYPTDPLMGTFAGRADWNCKKKELGLRKFSAVIGVREKKEQREARKKEVSDAIYTKRQRTGGWVKTLEKLSLQTLVTSDKCIRRLIFWWRGCSAQIIPSSAGCLL